MSNRRRTLKRMLVVLAAASLLIGLIVAAPAAGDTDSRDTRALVDNPPGQIIAALPYVDTIATGTATTYLGEPAPCGVVGHTRSVWYYYTATVSGNITASTGGSGYNTVVAVYPTIWTNPAISCNDDFGGGLTSQVTFAATAGTTYYFQISDAAGGVGGNLVFNVAGAAVAGTGSDTYPPAVPITTVPFTETINTTAFTTNVPVAEPVPTCAAGGVHSRSAWYAYTPALSGNLTADTFGANYDTVIQVYQGSTATPVVNGCNDNTGIGTTSQVTFAALAGATYYFQVSAVGTPVVATQLTFSLTGVGGGNWDDYYQPMVITTLPYSHLGANTAAATVQVGELPPQCAIGHSHSVWYRYTPTTTTAITANTSGANYNTVIQVYQGSWALPLTCNDDVSTLDATSQVSFTAYANTTYYFQVSSTGTSAGGTLNFRVNAGTTAWDDYYQPMVITRLPYTHTGNTTAATTQTGEPTPSCAFSYDNSVWYSWRATEDAQITANTRGSNYDTVLAVYQTSWASRVACNDDISTTDPDSEVTFTARSGTTYYFQVASVGYPSSGGTLVFNVNAGPDPAWDDYANPFIVTTLPFNALGVDTGNATTQTGEPIPSCVTGHSNSVWYSYTPTTDVAVTADTYGADYDTVIGVYRNTWASPVTCDDDGGSVQSVVSFTAEAGETYLFQISSKGATSDGGELDFHITGVNLPQFCRGVEATIVGTESADVIRGTTGIDVVVALGGNDIILTYGGDDLICAGIGNDKVFAGGGNDRVFTQRGDDVAHGGPGADILHGWGGADELRGKGGPDEVYGGAGDDELHGNGGFDVLRGGAGDDLCYTGEDVIC